MSDFSENEDDPVVSSSDEWEEEVEKKRSTRRISSRLSKKPRVVLSDSVSSGDSEDEFKVKPKSKSRNPPTRKPKGNNEKTKEVVREKEKEKETNSITKVSDSTCQLATKEFQSGSFVIAKADAQSYDPTNPPHIWRIDGKALLQKYEPYEDNGDLKYKNTSIYTGWSALESDKYAPLKDINVLSNTNQKFILSFNPSQLKTIIYDSD